MPAEGYQIHKQQLFHWIGRGLQKDNRGKKVLTDPLAQQALDHIASSLDNGLWVKKPRVPELFTLGQQKLCLNMPIACFTEWSLGESLPHTSHYGRIGFGFPKKWVIERGGQSVTYFRHAPESLFLKTIFKVLKSVATPVADGYWRPKPGHALDELLYLVHFAKMVRASAAVKAASGKPKPKPAARPKPKAKKARLRKPAGPTFIRKFGAELPFVEEREWRIVYHPDNKYFRPGPGNGLPDYYLPYIPGEELFTLVVPDSKVMSRLFASTYITERLFTPEKFHASLKGSVPPVTVLAHSDIGTF